MEEEDPLYTCLNEFRFQEIEMSTSKFRRDSDATPQQEEVTSRVSEKREKPNETKQDLTKSEKIQIAIGTVDELVAYIGRIKAQFFTNGGMKELSTSERMFLFAKMTQIQESLYDCASSLLCFNKNDPKYKRTRFSDKKVIELQQDIEKLEEVKNDRIIAGTSILESELLFARTMCRKISRQIVLARNLQIGFIPEETVTNFLLLLEQYFQRLSKHVLKIENKEQLYRD